MPLMPHHNHLCLTEGGLEIIISKLNRIKSAIELCVYAFSNFYRTAIISNSPLDSNMCDLISDAIDKLKEFETVMPVHELGDVLSKVKHKLELLLEDA